MKLRKSYFFGTLILPAISLLVFTGSAGADTRIKAPNVDNLDLATSWDIQPVPGDIGQWNLASAGGNTVAVGAGVNLGAVQLTNPNGLVTINTGTGPLTLGGATINGTSSVGIDLSGSTQNLTLGATVSLGANQTWLLGTGRTVTVNGGIGGGINGVTMQGLSTFSVGTTAASTFTGTLGLNGTNTSFTNSATVVNNIFSPSSSLSLASGFLRQNNTNTAGGFSQTFVGTTIRAGAAQVQNVRTTGAIPQLILGTVTRSGVGGTVNFNGSSANGVAGIHVTNTGFIGGWAFYRQNGAVNDPQDFANGNGAAAILTTVAHTGGANIFGPGLNTDVTGNFGVTGGTDTQSLRFGTATAATVTLNGLSRITSGGILVNSTVASNNQLITGGTLAGSTGGDLIVYQNSGTAVGGLGTLTIDSVIANATSATALTKAGTGTLILGGSNTFTGGIFVNSGEIRLANAGAVNSTTPNAVTFTNGNTTTVLSQILSLNGNSVSVPALTTTEVVGTGAAAPVVQNIHPTTPATLTLDNAIAGTFAGTIRNGTSSAALGLTKTGAGTQNLAGALTYTGATTVNGGILKLSASNNLNASSNITVGSAATLDVSLVAGGLTMSSGKTLSGSGTVLGAVTLNSGSTATPGGAGNVGTLFVDSLTVNSGSTTNFDFGVGNDVIDVSTALDFAAFSTGGFSLLTTGGAQVTTSGPTAYTLFDHTGAATVTGVANLTPSLIVNPVGGLTYTFADDGNHITLTIGGTALNNPNWIRDSASGNWSAPGNWSTGIVPTNASESANFVATSPNNPAHTVVLDSNRTVGSLTFNSATSYSVTGLTPSETLSLNNGGFNSSITDVSGNHSISAAINLITDTNLNVTNTAATLTLSGPISGTPSLGKFGSGTAVLSGTNSYAGVTTVNVGTLRFATTAALYSSNTANWTDTNIVVNSGATAAFNVGGAGEFTATDILALSGLGTVTGGFKAGSIIGLDTTNAGGSFTYSNIIGDPNATANSLGVSKLGTGALILDQPNTYTGGTVLQAGALHVNNGSAIGTGSLTINGGSLDNSSGGLVTLAINPQNWNGNFTFAGTNDLNLGTGAVVLGADTALTVSAGNLIVGGGISGGANFTKTGPGTLILTGVGSYSGVTTISGGILQIGNGAGVGGLPATQIINNSILAYNTTANHNIPSQITGTGSVTVSTGGANIVNFLNTANAFTGGLTINAGGRAALGNSGTGTYFGTGVLTMSGGTLFCSNAGSNNKTFAQNIVLTAATVNGLDTVGSSAVNLTGNISGSGTLNRTGGTGVLTFSNPNNSGFTGAFSTATNNNGITFATVGSGSSGAAWDFSATAARTVTLANLAGGTISFGSLNANLASPNTITNTTTAVTISVGGTGVDSTYGGVIGGLAAATGISLTKVGIATFTLTGTNSYTGATTVSAGTLQINGTNAGTGAVSIAAPGTLKGIGSVAGAVTATGIIAPGNSIGSLTVGAASFLAGGELDIENDDATTPRSDKLLTTGALNLTNAKLKLITTGTPAVPPFVIAHYGTTLTGKFASSENLPVGAAINYGYNDGVDSKNIAVVIPTTYELWALSKGLDLGINSGPSQDADNDGISNIVEYVVGGDPLVTNTGLIPTLTPDGTNFIFTFSREDASEAGAALTFQYGSDLAGWNDVAIGAGDNLPVVDVTENFGAADTITITIPKGANPSLFGRLKAVATP